MPYSSLHLTAMNPGVCYAARAMFNVSRDIQSFRHGQRFYGEESQRGKESGISSSFSASVYLRMCLALFWTFQYRLEMSRNEHVGTSAPTAHARVQGLASL